MIPNCLSKNGKSKFKLNCIGKKMEYKEVVLEDVQDYFCVTLGPPYLLNHFLYGKGSFCLKDERLTVYLVDGFLHRDNAPALIYRDNYINSRGMESDEFHLVFYRHGQKHNESGPAHYYYDLINNKYEETYLLFGEEVSKQEFDQKMLTKLYW